MIFATHPDADHIAGLRAHFETAPCVPDQIIRPLTTIPDLQSKFQIVPDLFLQKLRGVYKQQEMLPGQIESAERPDARASSYLSRWQTVRYG